MKTFPLKHLWLKTVFKTDLEHLSPEQILHALEGAGIIRRVGADRYMVVRFDSISSKEHLRSIILNILRECA